MYWRIRKITPDQLVRQYGVHAVLIVSVLFNIGLFTRVNAGKALSTTQKTDYDKFARQVTQHLFDASYPTVEESMNAILTEVGPDAAKQMRADQTIPRDATELRAIVRQLTDSKSISCLKFESVEVRDPDPQQKGYLPVDLKVKVFISDAQGVRPSTIRLRYLLGTATDTKNNTSKPVVVDVRSQFDPN